jgi:hypothetical protein
MSTHAKQHPHIIGDRPCMVIANFILLVLQEAMATATTGNSSGAVFTFKGEDIDNRHTWANGNMSGPYKFFSVSGKSEGLPSVDELTSTVLGSEMKVG